MGGKDPFIVCSDVADRIDVAAKGGAWAAFLNSGQVCTSAERFYVMDDVYDDYLSAFVDYTQSLVIGDPMQSDTDIGPMVSAAQRQKVADQVEAAVGAGAEVVVGGDGAGQERGHFFSPAVVTGAAGGDRPAARGDLRAGRAAGPGRQPGRGDRAGQLDAATGSAPTSTREDFKTILRCMREVKAGTVWFNDPLTDNDAGPFGGFKQSGLGRELGREGLEAFQETKHVHIESEVAPKEWWYPVLAATRAASRRTGRSPGEWPTRPKPRYLDAVVAYVARDPGRFHIPGHKGTGADPGLIDALGEAAILHDVPPSIEGIDVGPEPTPFQRAQRLAADAWGAQRSWFLVNGASGGNHAICMTLAHATGKLATGPPHRGRVVVQRNVHSSIIDGLVLSGLRPTFVAPEIDRDLGIAHCVTPEALDAALESDPEAVAAMLVSPTYFGAVARIEELAEVAHARDVPLVVDEAWGSHLYFHRGAADGRPSQRRRPGSLQHPQDRRQPRPSRPSSTSARAGRSTRT